MNHSRISIFNVLVFLSIFILPQVAISKTYTVNVFDDPTPDLTAANGCDNAGRCSLREAVYAAGVNGDASSTINLPAGTYLLTIAGSNEDAGVTGDLDILNHSLTINGTAGADKTIIDASGLNDRVFDYPMAAGANVKLNGLTIKGGSVGSTTGRFGGGLHFTGGGATDILEINSSVITGNTALGAAGLYASKAKLTIQNSTISLNTATDSSGGGAGLFVLQLISFEMNNSTISGNNTAGRAAAIAFADSSIPAIFRNVTISNNTAAIEAGGLYLVVSNVNLQNSILYGNKGAGGVDDNCSKIGTSTFESKGYNVIGAYNTASPCDAAASTDLSASPSLQALANNGGPTPTHLLNSDSIAINAGNPAGCQDSTGANLTQDQRGLARPATAGTRCDIGAVEMQPAATGTGGTGTGGAGSGSGSGTPAAGGSSGCSINVSSSSLSIVPIFLLYLTWFFVGGWIRFRKNN